MATGRTRERTVRAPARGRVTTRRVYEEPAETDGTRILVMRLWPRGVRKDRVDLWLRDLAPDLALMRGFLAGKVLWAEYRRRYLAGLARPEARAALAQVAEFAREGPVTLLCWCADEQRCHRSLLRERVARLL